MGLPFPIRVNLEIIVMKGYTTLPRPPEHGQNACIFIGR